MLKKLLNELITIIPCIICKSNSNNEITSYNFFSNLRICNKCLNKIEKIKKVIWYKNIKITILYKYNTVLKELILRWKFFNDKHAREIIYFLFKSKFSYFKLIIFPPSEKRKEGFIPFIELLSDKNKFMNIFTKKNTHQQSRKPFSSRKANFKLLNSNHRLKNFILIDDVYTSGETIKECIDLLLNEKIIYFPVFILSTTQK